MEISKTKYKIKRTKRENSVEVPAIKLLSQDHPMEQPVTIQPIWDHDIGAHDLWIRFGSTVTYGSVQFRLIRQDPQTGSYGEELLTWTTINYLTPNSSSTLSSWRSMRVPYDAMSLDEFYEWLIEGNLVMQFRTTLSAPAVKVHDDRSLCQWPSDYNVQPFLALYQYPAEPFVSLNQYQSEVFVATSTMPTTLGHKFFWQFSYSSLADIRVTSGQCRIRIVVEDINVNYRPSDGSLRLILMTRDLISGAQTYIGPSNGQGVAYTGKTIVDPLYGQLTGTLACSLLQKRSFITLKYYTPQGTTTGPFMSDFDIGQPLVSALYGSYGINSTVRSKSFFVPNTVSTSEYVKIYIEIETERVQNPQYILPSTEINSGWYWGIIVSSFSVESGQQLEISAGYRIANNWTGEVDFYLSRKNMIANAPTKIPFYAVNGTENELFSEGSFLHYMQQTITLVSCVRSQNQTYGAKAFKDTELPVDMFIPLFIQGSEQPNIEHVSSTLYTLPILGGRNGNNTYFTFRVYAIKHYYPQYPPDPSPITPVYVEPYEAPVPIPEPIPKPQPIEPAQKEIIVKASPLSNTIPIQEAAVSEGKDIADALIKRDLSTQEMYKEFKNPLSFHNPKEIQHIELAKVDIANFLQQNPTWRGQSLASIQKEASKDAKMRLTYPHLSQKASISLFQEYYPNADRASKLFQPQSYFQFSQRQPYYEQLRNHEIYSGTIADDIGSIIPFRSKQQRLSQEVYSFFYNNKKFTPKDRFDYIGKEGTPLQKSNFMFGTDHTVFNETQDGYLENMNTPQEHRIFDPTRDGLPEEDTYGKQMIDSIYDTFSNTKNYVAALATYGIGSMAPPTQENQQPEDENTLFYISKTIAKAMGQSKFDKVSKLASKSAQIYLIGKSLTLAEDLITKYSNPDEWKRIVQSHKPTQAIDYVGHSDDQIRNWSINYLGIQADKHAKERLYADPMPRKHETIISPAPYVYQNHDNMEQRMKEWQAKNQLIMQQNMQDLNDIKSERDFEKQIEFRDLIDNFRRQEEIDPGLAINDRNLRKLFYSMETSQPYNVQRMQDYFRLEAEINRKYETTLAQIEHKLKPFKPAYDFFKRWINKNPLGPSNKQIAKRDERLYEGWIKRLEDRKQSIPRSKDRRNNLVMDYRAYQQSIGERRTPIRVKLPPPTMARIVLDGIQESLGEMKERAVNRTSDFAYDTLKGSQEMGSDLIQGGLNLGSNILTGGGNMIYNGGKFAFRKSADGIQNLVDGLQLTGTRGYNMVAGGYNLLARGGAGIASSIANLSQSAPMRKQVVAELNNTISEMKSNVSVEQKVNSTSANITKDVIIRLEELKEQILEQQPQLINITKPANKTKNESDNSFLQKGLLGVGGVAATAALAYYFTKGDSNKTDTQQNTTQLLNTTQPLNSTQAVQIKQQEQTANNETYVAIVSGTADNSISKEEMIALFEPEKMTASSDDRYTTMKAIQRVVENLDVINPTQNQNVKHLILRTLAFKFDQYAQRCIRVGNKHGYILYKTLKSIIKPEDAYERQLNQQLGIYVTMNNIYDVKNIIAQPGVKEETIRLFVQDAHHVLDFVEKITHSYSSGTKTAFNDGLYITGRKRSYYDYAQPIQMRQPQQEMYIKKRHNKKPTTISKQHNKLEFLDGTRVQDDYIKHQFNPKRFI